METSISPDMSFGSNASRIQESFLLSASSTACCLKRGLQNSLKTCKVSLSGMMAGTDFMPEPEISLNVDPKAIPSMVGNACLRKKYIKAVPTLVWGMTDLKP